MGKWLHHGDLSEFKNSLMGVEPYHCDGFLFMQGVHKASLDPRMSDSPKKAENFKTCSFNTR